MGSKKHKKESKKKKHRSRSRSPLDVEERERKRHHKKHKDRKKDRSPDVEEVPVDSHLLPAAEAASSRSRSRSSSAQRHTSREHEKEQSPSRGGGAQESLSIEESNRLRAKLGLKPLDLAEKTADDGKIKDDLGEFYHKPASNIAQQKKADKLREKLEVRREKRKLEQKLQTTLLAEESDDEDAIAWVKKSREIEEQKKAADKRAALLDELDAAFGVAALVQERQAQAQQTRYSNAHLKGLRVAHDIHALGEEREVVLTLADAPVLAEDAEDVLVNVNMLDDERYNKNILERKKAAAGYQAYDEEAEVAAALGLARPLLAKYDDEIDKDKPDKKKGFRIGDDDSIEANKFRDLMRQERLASAPGRRLESLQLPALRPAADYLDEHEIQAKFKKPKKKGKMRQRAKAEPIDVDDYEAGALPLHTDDTEVKPEQLTLAAAAALQQEEEEPECELQAALDRARRLRLAHHHHTEIVPKVEKLLERVKEEEGQAEGGAIVLDATAEFCRTLGDIPTYGQAGNRDHHAEIMEMEQEEGEGTAPGPGPGPGAEAGGAWSRVDVHSEQAPDLAAGSSVALDAEPALGGGVAGALQLALSKGYLEKAGTAPAPRTAPHHLAARHYSIEDKSHAGEDDKYGRRERGGHSGPLQEFRERSGFRPHVKLEYVDDEGRPLCPKEAFRYLSHKFHGKGPGKNKQEKRIKKAVQEGLMKKMSSTDTPLGTLQMLQEKQRETHSPYVVLSGAKREHK